jgi:hypothetical protein
MAKQWRRRFLSSKVVVSASQRRRGPHDATVNAYESSSSDENETKRQLSKHSWHFLIVGKRNQEQVLIKLL